MPQFTDVCIRRCPLLSLYQLLRLNFFTNFAKSWWTVQKYLQVFHKLCKEKKGKFLENGPNIPKDTGPVWPTVRRSLHFSCGDVLPEIFCIFGVLFEQTVNLNLIFNFAHEKSPPCSTNGWGNCCIFPVVMSSPEVFPAIFCIF